MSNCQSIFAFGTNIFNSLKLQKILTDLATYIDLNRISKNEIYLLSNN